MFSDANWQKLHTRIARYIAPYDAAVRPYSLALAREWIEAAEQQHVKILVAFYHSEYTPTRLPSVSAYQRDIKKFMRLFPNVREYQPYNEANRGNVPHAFSSPSPELAAQYYRALTKVCKGCKVVGLDVLDATNITPTLRYIQEFKRALSHLHVSAPRTWGLHNYSDVNRFQTTRTRTLVGALGGEVWLTETGGIVHFGSEFPNRHGSGLARAARAIRLMFSLAGSHPSIRRLYIFDWKGGTSHTRFDAGLTDERFNPRPGYVAVCRAMHAAGCPRRVSNR